MTANSRHFQREIIIALIVLALVSVIFTWPLLLHIQAAVPQGSESPAVAYFQLFTAQWTSMALPASDRYWDAPFFHPFKGSFAWSEPQLFTAVIISVLAKISGFIVAYNVIILLYMVLMGSAGYIGARLLTRDRAAALWSGIWMCAGPYSLQQICAPALLSVWSVFFLIICVFLCVIKERRLYFWLAVLFYIIVWFTCKQLAFMATLFLPFCLWPWIFPASGRFQIQRIAKFFFYAALGIGLAVMIVLPYALQQLSKTHSMGFARSLSGNSQFFKPACFFMPATGHWLVSSMLKVKLYSWSIGVVMVAVILLAMILGFGRSIYLNKTQKKIVIGLLSLVLVSFAMVLGPGFGFYSVLFSHIPGFIYIRAHSRNIVFAAFAIAMLGAYAFAFIRKKLTKGLPVRCVTVFAYVLLFAEMWTMPIQLVFPAVEIEGHRQVIDWLRANDTQGPVVELPVRPNSRDMEAASMLRMLQHGHPLISGYCSFTPVPYSQLKKALIDDPAGKGREYLSAYDARYLVVHMHQMPSQDYAVFSGEGDTVVFKGPEHVIIKRSQALYIGKEEEFIPKKADFGSITPLPGKTYSLKLRRPVLEATLIDFSRSGKFPMMWKDDSGMRNRSDLKLLGSVILDKGANRLFFRLLPFAGKDKQAQGVLVNR